MCKFIVPAQASDNYGFKNRRKRPRGKGEAPRGRVGASRGRSGPSGKRRRKIRVSRFRPLY